MYLAGSRLFEEIESSGESASTPMESDFQVSRPDEELVL